MAASYSYFLLGILEHAIFLSVLFDGMFLRVNVYLFQLLCLDRWLFRLLLSSSFLVVAMTSSLVILPFFSHAYQINIFFLTKLAASYSYFSLAILDLGRQIEESKFPRTI